MPQKKFFFVPWKDNNIITLYSYRFFVIFNTQIEILKNILSKVKIPKVPKVPKVSKIPYKKVYITPSVVQRELRLGEHWSWKSSRRHFWMNLWMSGRWWATLLWENTDFFFYRYVSTNHYNEHHRPNVDFNHCSSTSIRATFNRLLIVATLENEHPTRRVQQRRSEERRVGKECSS